MRSRHVGNVVVVEGGNKCAVSAGIVTDRDIVVEVVAEGLDPSQLTVGDIMSEPLFTASADQGLFETVEQM